MDAVLPIVFLVFGLVIGSFLNVVILRYNTGKSFGGRSACMSCQKGLPWYELVPFFSFIALRGRCSGCKTGVSIQYPLVEIVTGFLFGLLFVKLRSLFFLDFAQFVVLYSYYAVLISILIVIGGYDIKHKIIPDMLAFVFGFLALSGLFLFTEAGFDPHLPARGDILSGFAVSVPFALIWLLSFGRWMGLGDAKLALGLGWMLGISRVFSGAVLAFWSGALIGVVLLLFSKNYKVKSEIPFAPFLIFGSLLAFFLELRIFPLF